MLSLTTRFGPNGRTGNAHLQPYAMIWQSTTLPAELDATIREASLVSEAVGVPRRVARSRRVLDDRECRSALLRRAPEESDHTCWFAGDGWWLSTAPPAPVLRGNDSAADMPAFGAKTSSVVQPRIVDSHLLPTLNCVVVVAP
jgi:hypothetical protein